MMGAYCASKFALRALSDALRREVAGYGVRVVLIEPGAVRTEFDQTARRHLADGGLPPDSPYRGLWQRMEPIFLKALERAPGPEAVSQAIQRAIEAPNPRPRYQVGADAAWSVRLLHLVPDTVLDRATAWALSPRTSRRPLESER